MQYFRSRLHLVFSVWALVSILGRIPAPLPLTRSNLGPWNVLSPCNALFQMCNVSFQMRWELWYKWSCRLTNIKLFGCFKWQVTTTQSHMWISMGCPVASRDSTKSIIAQHELPSFESYLVSLCWREQCRANRRQGNEETLFTRRTSLKGGGPRT